MPVRPNAGLPKVGARQRWAVSLKAGPDLEYLLGIPSGATDLFAGGAAASGLLSSVLSSLKDVGTVEDFQFPQARTIKERYAFGPNPLEPFQNVPQQITRSLRLTRVILKKLPEVESLFNFAPMNLLHQQIPFIIQILDIGDATPETSVRHLLFGCWFQESGVKYDVVTKDDTRLIQSTTVKVGRVLTFDPSAAGSAGGLIASTVLGALVSAGGAEAQTLLENFGLS
jgi:hypothetical protein